MNTSQTIKINMTLTINIILLNNVDRFYTARQRHLPFSLFGIINRVICLLQFGLIFEI